MPIRFEKDGINKSSSVNWRLTDEEHGHQEFSLTDADVCVYAGIARCARQVLVLPICDVLVCARVSVPLGKSKIYDVHRVVMAAQPDQEVVGLDIAMDETLPGTSAQLYRISKYRDRSHA